MNDVGEKLRARGLRCTRQRELVYGALCETAMHPTAEELLGTVRRADKGISLATVYNTLEALCECGLVQRRASEDGLGACRFDATVEPHAHVLLDDGRLMDVPREISERLVGSIDEGAMDDLARALGVARSRLELRLGVRVNGDRESCD